jgi:hypothetical protein
MYEGFISAFSKRGMTVSETFTVGPVPAFLPEIKGHGCQFVSQYVQRSS